MKLVADTTLRHHQPLYPINVPTTDPTIKRLTLAGGSLSEIEAKVRLIIGFGNFLSCTYALIRPTKSPIVCRIRFQRWQIEALGQNQARSCKLQAPSWFSKAQTSQSIFRKPLEVIDRQGYISAKRKNEQKSRCGRRTISKAITIVYRVGQTYAE